MNQDANYAITGIFVIGLTFILVIGIIWLSSGLSFTQSVPYEVDMREAVSGLNVNAIVEYNGVNVGRVKKIEINHDTPRFVQLLLDINRETPITLGTRATLNTRGLTGMSYIALKDNGENTIPLKVLPHHKYPIIPTNASMFLQWDATLSRLTESIDQVSHSIQQLLNSENLAYINKTLKNFDQFSHMLVINREQMVSIIRQSNNILATVQQQTLPTLDQLVDHLNQSVINFSIISDEMRRNPSILLRGRAPVPGGPGE